MFTIPMKPNTNVLQTFQERLQQVTCIPQGSSLSDSSHFRVLDRISELTYAHVRDRFPSNTRWWTSTTADAILEVVCELSRRRQISSRVQGKETNRTVKWRILQLPFDQVSSQPLRSDNLNTSLKPFSGLGKDATWRKEISVGVVATFNQQHFVTVAIFGPEKLVAIFDSAAGIYDHESFWEVSSRRHIFTNDQHRLGRIA